MTSAQLEQLASETAGRLLFLTPDSRSEYERTILAALRQAVEGVADIATRAIDYAHSRADYEHVQRRLEEYQKELADYMESTTPVGKEA